MNKYEKAVCDFKAIRKSIENGDLIYHKEITLEILKSLEKRHLVLITPNSNVESALKRITYGYEEWNWAHCSKDKGIYPINECWEKDLDTIKVELSKIPALENVINKQNSKLNVIKKLVNNQLYTGETIHKIKDIVGDEVLESIRNRSDTNVIK